jgi:hypothetical protein
MCLGGKYNLVGFSTGPYCQDHPAVLCGILDSGGLAAIFVRLEHAGLLYLASFAGKIPGDVSHQSCCPASVYCCGMGSEHIRKTCHSLCHRLEGIVVKNGVTIE